MKRKEKKSMLLRLYQEVKLLPEFVGDSLDSINGFCALIGRRCIHPDVFDILCKYKTRIPNRGPAYWFPSRDWKIRLSFLEEVMKVELNPFYGLMYKLGLYKFKY